MKNANNFFKAWQNRNYSNLLKYSQDSCKKDVKAMFKGLRLESFKIGEVVSLGSKCKGVNVEAVVNGKDVSIRAIYVLEGDCWGINPISVTRLK